MLSSDFTNNFLSYSKSDEISEKIRSKAMMPMCTYYTCNLYEKN